MQSPSVTQIDHLVIQISSLAKFETSVVVQRTGVIDLSVADLSWNRSTNVTTVRVRSELEDKIGSCECDSLGAALTRLKNYLPDFLPHLDTMAVIAHDDRGERFLEEDDELFNSTCALWSETLGGNYGERSVAALPVVPAFEEVVRGVDKLKLSVWTIHNEYFREIEITSNRNGKFLYVYRRNSINALDGFSCRVSDVRSAFNVLKRFAGNASILVDTLLILTNRNSHGHSADEAETDEAALSCTREFLLEAIPATEPDDDSVAAKLVGKLKGDEKTFRTRVKKHNTKIRSDYITKLLLSYLLVGGKKGVQLWNDVPGAVRALAKFKGERFEKCNFVGIKFGGADFKNCVFDGAQLKKCGSSGADFSESSFVDANLCDGRILQSKANRANFTGADLSKCRFSKSQLREANFHKANVADADFSQCELQSADFSSCNADQAKSFSNAKYDEHTKFPADFVHWGDLLWDGDAADPYKAKRLNELSSNFGMVGFEEFIDILQDGFDSGRLKKALSMLKAESFQLFSEQDTSGVIGVVKSQTDPDLIYACKLGSEGTFCCCTQNLNPCGGLRGALCKHILVLVIGLTKAGQLDSTEAAKHVMASKSEVPKLDKGRMTGVFLKYKGAETGEVDWRPTETIPEDYYAF